MRFKDAYNITSSWTSSTVKRLDSQGIELNAVEKNGILKSSENLVSIYGLDAKRKYETNKKGEKLFAFQHPLNVFTLMLDFYSSEFSKDEPEFRKCFEDNTLSLVHTSLNHDSIESGLISFEDMVTLYTKIKLSDPELNAKYCEILDRGEDRSENGTVQYLNNVFEGPITRYVKTFDMGNNSQSIKYAKGRGVDSQLIRMFKHYGGFVHRSIPSLDEMFKDNIIRDLSQTKVDILIEDIMK